MSEGDVVVERPERRSRERVATSQILVVDDSTAIRRILRRYLEAAGYSVSEAANGQAGLDACRSSAPDLMLLDVDMPVMDGPTALALMKGDDALAGIPVLFLTARTGASELAAGLQLGAQDYLRKPCEAAELVARVQAALHVKAQENQLRQQAVDATRLSMVDVLTGLGNRRKFDQRATELLAIAGAGMPVGVLMVDVDHFKLVNDREGHPVGDIVLRILAARMRNAVSDPALLVRWGGEEFVVLAPGISASDLGGLGEAIRTSVASSPFAVVGGRLLQITVSVGCACGRLDGLDAAIDRSDGALYEAKRDGRNRVVTATSVSSDAS